MSAPLVTAVTFCNAAAVVDVPAQPEQEETSGTPTPPSCIVGKNLLDGVGVGANLDGSTDAATATPSAFLPPSCAAAVGNVDVTAKHVARVNSETPTLPADGPPGTAVGVCVKFETKTSCATSTPVLLRFTIASFAMASVDDEDDM